MVNRTPVPIVANPWQWCAVLGACWHTIEDADVPPVVRAALCEFVSRLSPKLVGWGVMTANELQLVNLRLEQLEIFELVN